MRDIPYSSVMRAFLTALIAFAFASSAIAADQTVAIHPASGHLVELRGTIKGYDGFTYTFDAEAGDRIDLELLAKSASVNFNLRLADSQTAIFSTMSGDTGYFGPLAHGGLYAIDVYLVRAVARRGQKADFRLNVTLTQRPPFDRTLVAGHIAFSVSSPNHSVDNRIRIVPSGLTIDNSVIDLPIDGKVIHAEVGDLDADGSPEIYITIRHANGNGSMLAYAANARKSLSQIAVPALDTIPGATAGYNGGDAYAVLEGVLGRRFPIGDGRMRQIQYRLRPGEATWQLAPEKVFEF